MADVPATATPDSRTVSLVVDEPRGVLGPMTVSIPWWQEVTPVVEAAWEQFGVNVTVVRLLAADRPYPGGHVHYLAEAPHVDPSLLDPWTGGLENDPKRAFFAHVGASADLLAWARVHLDAVGIIPTGVAQQVRTWNLAAIWKIPTDAGPMWLKATPEFLAHEWQVLSQLNGSAAVPELIAGESGRVLMRHADGIDGYGIGEEMTVAVDLLIDAQSVALEVAGIPQVTAASFASEVERLGERRWSELSPNQRNRLDVLRNEMADRFAVVKECADVLVHGDFHGGNLRVKDGRPSTILDWGDSFIGCPLFDVFALESYDVEGADRIRCHWLERLNASPEAWEAFRPVAALLLPVVLQRFVDNIERSELPYHDADVLPALTAALNTVD